MSELDNVVRVGRRSPMSYVVYAHALRDSGVGTVVLRARGVRISKIPKVFLLLKKFNPNMTVDACRITQDSYMSGDVPIDTPVIELECSFNVENNVEE